MSAPSVPQRPARSQEQPPQSQQPPVPARPARSVERSINRDTSSRSPLNMPPPDRIQNGTAGNSIRRPPSVAALPSIGGEGDEYAALDQPPETQAKSAPMDPGTTSHIAHDMPLHAPKASAPAGDRQRLVGVTRTDSARASVAGIGKPVTEYNPGEVSSRPRSRADRPSSAYSHSRPGSISHDSHHEEDEHGIPEIGVRVPMYPNAGDVQAPTPGSSSHTPASGIGFFNSGSRPPTSDGRRRSAQGFHVPPDAYGLHGHGVGPQDQFEAEWYKKHPEERQRELHGAYGPAVSSERHEWTLSSEQLNKLVQGSAKHKPIHAKVDANGAPSEAMGYAASDLFSSRANSPKPLALHKTKSHDNNLPAAESPLRRSAFPEGTQHYEPRGAESTDDETYHVDAPVGRGSRLSMRSHDGHDDPIQEEDIPILASDEVSKNPGAEWFQPAVSPEAERHLGDEEYFSGIDDKGVPQYQKNYRNGSRSRSRQSGNRQGHGLARFVSREETGTPLGGIEEYEPLFGEGDDEPKKPLTQADRLKRPELHTHRFPSQDIWEDTPDSLRLESEVDTPEEPKAGGAKAAAVFESPEEEAARQRGLPIKPKFNPAVQKEVSRPQLQHRFPSQDIWEDSPESAQLESEVHAAQEAAAVDDEAAGKPSIPARPVRSAAPAVPDRAKPSVPQRPAKKSPELDGVAKEKPSVPARPAGGSAKFASIKAGFMSDLNSRLKLGPQGSPPKQEEKLIAPEEEAAPLADARKSRARGPARRKPATVTSGETETPATGALAFSISAPQTIWSISPSGRDDLLVESSKMVHPEDGPMHAKDVYAHAPSPQLDALAAADDKSKRERLREITAEQVGHVGDAPETPEPTDVPNEAVVAPAEVSQKLAHAEPTKTGSSLDHTDPHRPTSMNAEAEEERKQELASLGLPVSSQATDRSVQTGEKHNNGRRVGDDSTNVKLTVIEGGDAVTGKDVVLPEER